MFRRIEEKSAPVVAISFAPLELAHDKPKNSAVLYAPNISLVFGSHRRPERSLLLPSYSVTQMK